MVTRRPGLSVRLKLTLSVAAVVVVTGSLLLAAVGLFLLRYIPNGNIVVMGPGGTTSFAPDRKDLLRAFAPVAGLLLLFLLMFGLVAGRFLAGRMLEPLGRIAGAARKAAAGSLSHRIALEGRRDELRELADIFDTMLQRLDRHMQRERRFAANASHELRTPLAVSQTLLEVAAVDPDRDVDALITRLTEISGRAIALTEALLTLSRADRPSLNHTPVDLSLLAEEAVEMLLPAAEARNVRLQVDTERAMTCGEPALLQQLTTNLMHNAIVHNHLAGGSVLVRTWSRRSTVVLEVENTGETLTPESVATFIEPFQRGSARTQPRAGDHAGTGLGLAIADRIVHTHDGALTLKARPHGGLTAQVRLPRHKTDND